MSRAYVYGDGIRLKATLTDPDSGDAVDPATLIFEYQAGSDATVVLTYGEDVEIVKSATGIYYIYLNLDTAGAWQWWWQATTPRGADAGYFNVNAKPT